MSFFINKITDDYNTFTASHKEVASYLMDNFDQCAFETLEDLAKKIGVSTTTIIRFSRVLGYSGYSEMQKDIQQNIQNKVALPERINESVKEISNNELLKATFASDIENMRKTLEVQKDEDLQEAIKSISNARGIYILGMRSSFTVAYYMASRLGEIKKRVRLIESVGMLYPEEIVDAGEGDVCVAYLFPRYSKTAATVMSWLRNQGVKIILITSMNYAAVNSYADVILPCAITSVYYKNSYAAPMGLTNYLIAALAKENIEESREVLEKTESILNQGYYLGL